MKFQKILVPIDFSPSALEAANAAIALARTHGGGTVTLLHVIDVIYYDYGWLTGGSIAVPRELVDQNRSKLEERLRKLITDTDVDNVAVETVIVEGLPFEQIVNAAMERKVDLIVMGTHGRRGVSHAFLGSVAERVVRLATVPVMTVKAEKA